jgi:hypothetical protein
MSISGISGQNYYSNAVYNQQNNRQQMQTDFAQLGQDLQSGNLTQAQSDYTNIQSLQQSMQANSNASGMRGMHHHHGVGGIEALLQELNSDPSTTTNVAQNTSPDGSSTQNQNSNSSSQSLQSIQSLISQYMQNMLTGMNNQESQAGALSLTNLNLTI